MLNAVMLIVIFPDFQPNLFPFLSSSIFRLI
jgi:hypothetical protein